MKKKKRKSQLWGVISGVTLNSTYTTSHFQCRFDAFQVIFYCYWHLYITGIIKAMCISDAKGSGWDARGRDKTNGILIMRMGCSAVLELSTTLGQAKTQNIPLHIHDRPKAGERQLCNLHATCIIIRKARSLHRPTPPQTIVGHSDVWGGISSVWACFQSNPAVCP